MHDFNFIDIARGKLVERYDILAHKYVITPYCHKVDFFCLVLTDIYLIAFSAKFKVHNIFKHGGGGLPMVYFLSSSDKQTETSAEP